MKEPDEVFEVVDEQGRVLRLASRGECHGDPSLLHRVVHVLVFDEAGRLFIQKRAVHKDIQPGKWDTSVGGHLCPGEDAEPGALRELEEELGIRGAKLERLYQYIMRSPVETELVSTFRTVWAGEIRPNARELADGRFWSAAEIEAALGKSVFTPNFEDEYRRWGKVKTPDKNEELSILLSKLEEDNFISRSQAKVLLVGAEKFRRIIMDFQDVKSVGQGFVDEVFRVFKNKYPEIKMDYINASEDVSFMLERGLAIAAENGENVKIQPE